jgi:single-strand DNA-binding protein
MNKWIGIGRLTRDPELVYSKTGTPITNFSIAINRRFNRDETDFIPCVCFKGLAENVANYPKKGSLVAVEGRIQVRSYEDRDGNKRKSTEIVCDDVRFLSPREGGAASKPQTDGWESLGREVGPGGVDITDDDSIPF